MPDLPDIPPLRDPLLIAAFEGWNDAGEAASQAIAHLIETWNAAEVATIDPEEYYDFQVNRPRVSTEAGERVLEWPDSRFYVAGQSTLFRDIVLLQAIEPSTRWKGYCREVLQVANHLGVREIVTIGALLADVPHTRPIPVGSSSDSADLRLRYGAEKSSYEGPTGIVGVLAHEAAAAGIPTISCWARVPHYAGGPPSPKAALALVVRLEQLLEVTIAREPLDELAQAWERGVDELAAGDDEVADYVASLEEDIDAAELPEASGDALAREFERYLRGRDDDKA